MARSNLVKNTTHFSNGVSNIGAGYEDHPMKNMGLLDPTHQYYMYFNDFFEYHADEWTITTTEGGSGAATEALTSSSGGALLITNDDADNDADFFNLKGESFKLNTSNPFFFKARLKVSDATQSDWVMGLQITDTTPLAVSDGIYFRKDDGDTDIDFSIMKDSTDSGSSAIATCGTDMMTVAFVYTPPGFAPSEYADTIRAYVTTGSTNGTQSVDYLVPAKVYTGASSLSGFCDDEELTISFGIQNGAAAAKTMTIDYVLAAVNANRG